MKKIVLSCIAILYSISVFSWGVDVEIPSYPSGKTSLVKTANGTLYCSVPVGQSGVGGINFFQSTDMGITWSLFSNPAMGQNVIKSKLMVTGTDSVYCAYQVDTSLFFYSLASNIVTPFTLMYVEDFDVVASPNSNSVYLFCDNVGTNAMNRYSSINGGFTWNGSTALVSSVSSHPRICMQGTRIILNYYNTNTTTGVVRAAIFNETGPGQLTSSTFQDVIPSGVSHQQFASVKSGNNVWLIFREGAGLNNIKYRLSTDGGTTYGAVATLAGSANVNASCFDAINYADVTGSGIKLVYYTDSAGLHKRMNYRTASSLTPNLFSAPEIFNDFVSICINETSHPSITTKGGDVGVLWLESNSGTPGLYFDIRKYVVGNSDIDGPNDIKIFPNPMQSILTVEMLSQGIKNIVVTDISGRIVHQVKTIESKIQIDLNFLQNGIYFIGLQNNPGIKLVKN
ncbi:MAG: T9SS type A sorting domain-containing protein [Bacteroidetes bacterium]|nr:T9SS type A sorting domain-containing protein [Bacteroidota bacterium]